MATTMHPVTIAARMLGVKFFDVQLVATVYRSNDAAIIMYTAAVIAVCPIVLKYGAYKCQLMYSRSFMLYAHNFSTENSAT